MVHQELEEDAPEVDVMTMVNFDWDDMAQLETEKGKKDVRSLQRTVVEVSGYLMRLTNKELGLPEKDRDRHTPLVCTVLHNDRVGQHTAKRGAKKRYT